LLKISEFKELGNLSTYDLRSDIFSSLSTLDEEISEFTEDVYINQNRLFLKDNEIFIEKGVTNE